MKLLSGNHLNFGYNPNSTKIYRNDMPWCKPFSYDLGIEAAMGQVYDHSPQYKSTRPNLIILTLGADCNKGCSYCAQVGSPVTASDPDVFLYLVRRNRNITAFARRFVFWGGEPLLYWDKLVHIYNTLQEEKLVRKDCTFAIRTNGLLMDREKAAWLRKHNFFVGLSNNGPWQEGDDPLEDGTESYKGLSLIEPRNFMINTVLTRQGFDRAELINHFFGALPNNHNPALQSFQGFTLTEHNQEQCLYLEDPVKAMVVMYNQYKNGLAEKFYDFWPLVQSFKYRLAMQNYDILRSYNRFSYDCLNINSICVDLNGHIYSDSTFDNHVDKIMGNLEHFNNLSAPDPSKYFIGNEALRARCEGCPVLPMCLGGDIFTPEALQEKECLQKFVFLAPIWTYFMNGHILETPITGIQNSAFLHKDIYLDYLNSDVYQSAVRGR